jgi:hypothetical protein
LLPSVPPPAGVLISGLMGNLEHAPIPGAWRAEVRMTYPLDLPASRAVRMNFPLGWFRSVGLPVTAEKVQVDTYLSCVILAETLGHMLDSFVPEYLVERLEMMIGRRLANAYYPRLTLAAGQRFASKGGYIVRFDGAEGARLRADTPWVAP